MIEQLNTLHTKWSQFSDSERSAILLKADQWLEANESETELIVLTRILQARDLVKRSNLLAGLKLLDEAQSIVAADPNSKWRPEIDQLRATIYQMQGHRQDAFELLVKAYTSAEAVENHVLLSRISLSLGIIATNSGDYDGGSVYLQRSIEHSTKGEVDPSQVAQAHLILAQAQLERGAHEEALHHAERSLRGYTSVNSLHANSAATLMASIHLDRKDLLAARSVFARIVSDGLTPFQEISILNLRSKLLALEGNFTEAIAKHDHAISLSVKIGNNRLKINSVQLKCETLLAASKFVEALALLNSIDADVKGGYDMLSLHELKAKAYEGIGKYEEALGEQKKFANLQKELLSQRASNALARLRAAQEVLQAEREAAHFRERSQFYAKELSQRTSYLVQQNEYVNNVIDHIQAMASQRPDAIDLLKDIRKRLRQLPAASFDWNEYLRLFDEIHPNALTILEEKYPALTPIESKICSLVLSKLSNVDIARLLSLSERTVENHRYRLRKKLGISVDVDLTAFLERMLAERPADKLAAPKTFESA
jgi:DNA-binding CsgD family transcriptional regulator